jgi:4-hydroxybenzoate polyprenyltransferase
VGCASTRFENIHTRRRNRARVAMGARPLQAQALIRYNQIMSRLSIQLRAWAEVGRISNLPTTASNVLVGSVLGGGLTTHIDWLRAGAAWCAIAMLYLAGMILNDVADIAIDRNERPGRPIPSGRITRTNAGAAVITLIVLALLITSILSWRASVAVAALVIIIAIYDFTHARSAVTVVLMGACRGLIYVIAALSVLESPNWPQVIIFASLMTIYTTSFSIIARRETSTSLDQRKWLALTLPLIPMLALTAIQLHQWLWPAIAMVVLWFVLALAARDVFIKPPRMKNAVMMWIAAISLLDAFLLTVLDRPLLALGAGACFIITCVAQRRVIGT